MKKWICSHKTIASILVVTMISLLLFAAVIKYAEEIVVFKKQLYHALRGNKDTAQSVQDDSAIPEQVYTGDEWFFDANLIYHACGGVNGLDYTNSKEAIESVLAGGGRFIEVDFEFTTDDVMVCVHDWNTDVLGKGGRLDAQTFGKTKAYGRYTTLSAQDIVQYMEKYPDLFIVVDTKDSLSRVIENFVSLTKSEDVLNRLIIQVYGPGEKSEIQNIYPFPEENYLLTVYKIGKISAVDTMKICDEEGMSVITASYTHFSAEEKEMLREKNFVLYEHTVNRPDIANRNLSQGVRGFYTDFMTMADLLPENITLPRVN